MHSHIIASTARRRTQKIKENIEIDYQTRGIAKLFFVKKLDLSSNNYKKTLQNWTSISSISNSFRDKPILSNHKVLIGQNYPCTSALL